MPRVIDGMAQAIFHGYFGFPPQQVFGFSGVAKRKFVVTAPIAAIIAYAFVDANYSAYAAALDEAGAYVSREDFDQVSHGRNWKEFLPPMLANVAARPEAVAARKEELYRSFVHLTVLNQGVARLLALSRPALPHRLGDDGIAAQCRYDFGPP